MFRRLAPVVAVMIGSACAGLAGLDDYGPTAAGGGGARPGTGGGDGEGGDEPTGCPPSPGGWQGPAAVYMGADAPPSCSGPWSLAEEGGIEPTLDACNCSCSIVDDPALQAGLCSDAFWEITWASNASCGMGVSGPTAQTDVCDEDPLMPVEVKSLAVEPTAPPMSGICEEDATNGFAGPADYATKVRVCAFDGAPDASAVCEREVPAGYPARLCVFRAGDVGEGCPTGYPDRQVIATSLVDQSECDCTCTENQVTCEATLELHDNANCQGSAVETAVANGTCQDLQTSSSFSHFEVHFAQAAGDCGAIAEITTDLSVQSELTLCCE